MEELVEVDEAMLEEELETQMDQVEFKQPMVQVDC
jgi:hypothetical protein